MHRKTVQTSNKMWQKICFYLEISFDDQPNIQCDKTFEGKSFSGIFCNSENTFF